MTLRASVAKRNPVETPGGTFYVDLWDPNGEHGPEAYAETEDGTVTVNGVEYRGTVYFRRYGHRGGKLFVSVEHLTRWDEKRGHHYPATPAAARKIDAWLRETVERVTSDTEAVTARRISSLMSSREYALVDANRAIGKANEIAEQVRALGGTVDDVPRFPLSRD